MKAAHYNSVENLVVFASLVLVAHAAGISNAVSRRLGWLRPTETVASYPVTWVKVHADPRLAQYARECWSGYRLA